MHAARSEEQASFERILREHRELIQLLDRIAAEESSESLHEELARLDRLLRAHFAHEESAEGLHAILGHSAPWRLREVDLLAREHTALLQAIAALRERLKGDSHRVAPGPRTEVGDLLTRLRDHEAREATLLGDTLTTDLGGSG
ncbi:MAG: hemerythrin domain-containing protein [Planctomycetota bacterium]